MRNASDCAIPYFAGGLIEANAPPGAPVLLALSGGADSRAALALLGAHCTAHHRPLFAAHLDHSIRPCSADDAVFCAKVCAAAGVGFFTQRVDVPALAAKSGRSLEEEAREARYGYFAALMREQAIPLLVTAHHADDNLETMLMRMVRGSGLRGLCGIPPARPFGGGMLVRPLLRAAKVDLLAYCAANGLTYVTDETNADTVYTRNRLRAEVLPVLASLNPALLTRAADTAEALRADEEYLSAAADALYASLDAPDRASLAWLREQPDAMRIRLFARLYAGGGGRGMLEGVHLRALGVLARPGEECALPGGITAVCDGEMLYFTGAGERTGMTMTASFEQPAKIGWQALAPIRAEAGLFPAAETVTGACLSENIVTRDINIYKLFINRHLNFDTIKGQLFWRTRQPGDTIVTRGHHHSIKKLLSSARVPTALRDRLPILCDAVGTVWLPGADCVRDGSSGGEDCAAVKLFHL